MKRLAEADPARLRAELSPRDLAMLTDTVAVTRIGTDSLAQNARPRTAWADLDIRFLPSTDPAELLGWVRSAIADPSVKVEVVFQGVPGPASPRSGLYGVIRRVLADRFPAAAIVSDVGPALSENRVLRVHGILTYGLTPFRVNYYDQAGVHGLSERIRLDWFDEGVETMKGIVRAWATGP